MQSILQVEIFNSITLRKYDLTVQIKKKMFSVFVR